MDFKSYPQEDTLIRKPLTTALRKQVYYAYTQKYGYNCFYCGLDLQECGVWYDHVLPLSCGGDDTEDNLVLSCPMCNRAKGTLDVVEFLYWLSHIRSNNFKCHALNQVELKPVHEDRLKTNIGTS
jgi:5-methylcytosine-specific restriction endonuclease McrA